jgi:UBX domain-containing protein 6
VRDLAGTDEFLQAVGFKITSLPFEDGETDFYVIDQEMAKDSSRLENIKEILETAEPIRPQLERNLKVYYPSSAASSFKIPDEFYNISPAELKREQQARQEATEKLGMLRTKAMRERDERRELTKYRFVLIRVRFHDVLLEGTFKANEPFSCVVDFVRENLEHDWVPFQLSSAGGQKLMDDSLTLAELGLAPAAVVNFAGDQEVMAEVNAQQEGKGSNSSLKPEIMARIQDL